MQTNEIVRAWKDNSYRNSLSKEQQALLPDNPVGETLTEEELQNVGGAGTSWTTVTIVTIVPPLTPTTTTTTTTVR